MDTFTYHYQGSTIELVRVNHDLFDVYINGHPHFCRRTPEECEFLAKRVIDQKIEIVYRKCRFEAAK